MSANAGSVTATFEGDASGLQHAADTGKQSVESFAKQAKTMAMEFVAGGVAIIASAEAISKAVEFMGQGVRDAAALGNGPSRTLLDTFEHVGLATRQLGADLMSDLAPAFNSLIAWFTNGADMGKILATVATLMGQAFRTLVEPLVFVAGAIKGLADTGTLKGALEGAATATAKLAEHGNAFQKSMLTAAEAARAIAASQQLVSNYKIAQEGARMQTNFQNLTGDRRQDRFAGATIGFDNFDQALALWKKNMFDAAEFVKQAAVADSYGSKIQAETLRENAEIANQAAEKAKLAADGFRMMKEKLVADTKAMQMAGNTEMRANTLTESQRGIDMARRSRDFGNIGNNQTSVTNQKIDGFKDFNDALQREAAALKQQDQLLAAAKMMDLKATQLAASSNMDGAEAALDSAANLKLLAQQAGVTATAADDAAKAFEAVKAAPSEFAEGLKVGAAIMTKNLGQLGQVINDVAQGWQQGGIWGALLALIMDLLSMVDGWKSIQAIANGQLKQALAQLSSGLGAVITGLKPLMGAIGMIQSAIMGVLNPILKLIGGILSGIAPIFASIGITLQLMSPILDVICRLLGAVLTPIFQALGPILTIVAESFLATELAIQYVILGLDMFVDWLDKATGNGNNQGSIDSDTASIAATTQQMQDLWNKGLDGLANSSADAAEQLGKTADAARSVTEQLLNVPEGIKVAALAFAATSAAGSSGGGSTSSSRVNSNIQQRNAFLRSGSTLASGYPRKKQ